MSWQACAHRGDATRTLLQPHQMLISDKDAIVHSIKQLDLIRVNLKLQQSALFVLECIIDRRQTSKLASTSAVLSSGHIQLHSWVLDVCSQLEGAIATLEKIQVAPVASVWLSLQIKFPLVTMFGSDTASLMLGESRVNLLSGSVQRRQIDLDELIERQLCVTGTLRAAQVGQLVPVTLVGDTYVFKVCNVKKNDKKSEKPMLVIVTGWSVWTNVGRRTDVTEKIAMLNIEEDGERKSGVSSISELEARLWQIGFVGYTAFVQDVLFNIALVLKRAQKSGERIGTMEQIGSHGVLLSGVCGVGKSLALIALHRELNRERIRIWRTDGMSLLMGAESSAFSSAFEYLVYNLEQRFPGIDILSDRAPMFKCVGVMLVDDLDVLFQSANSQIADGSDTQLPQLGSALLRLIGGLSLRNFRLVVVATTTSADTKIPAAAKRIGHFDKVLDLVVPTDLARCKILKRHLVQLPLGRQDESTTSDFAENLASRLALLTGGYVAKDLVRICRNAAAQAYAESLDGDRKMEPAIGWIHLLQAQQQVKPSQLHKFNVVSPAIEGKLVFAGYAAIQKQLFDFVSWKFHPTAAMSRLGISDASGILLSGPSGCGKTLLIQTLAAHAQVNFVSVKSSELLSKFFGDSEKTVRLLFARARAAAPCLLFFDEFDSIAHKRSFGTDDDRNSGSGVYARVLSTFLNEMDGVGSQRVAIPSVSRSKKAFITKNDGILVVAATNRIGALDAALVRPGRIDKNVKLGFPSQQDIQDILALYAKRMPLADDVDIPALAARPTGFRSFTGADVAAVCKEAAFRALREDTKIKTVNFKHFAAAWDQRAEATLTNNGPILESATTWS